MITPTINKIKPTTMAIGGLTKTLNKIGLIGLLLIIGIGENENTVKTPYEISDQVVSPKKNKTAGRAEIAPMTIKTSPIKIIMIGPTMARKNGLLTRMLKTFTFVKAETIANNNSAMIDKIKGDMFTPLSVIIVNHSIYESKL